MKKYALVAAGSSLLTAFGIFAFAPGGPSATVKLDNEKVRVVEMMYMPGVPRERGVRSTDQVIIFADGAKYERVDPKTGEKTIRERKPGEAIWHSKGEDAPMLTNVTPKPYRTFMIELK